MSEYYFINQHIVIPDNTAVLDRVSSDVELDPVDLLAGAKLRPEPTYIEVALSQTSGDWFPDMFSVPITLVSNTIKSIFDQCGINNIDFYPATLIDMNKNLKIDNYWLMNVLGRFNCIDESNSDTRRNALGNLKFKSFCIDETKILGAEVFRLNERGRMIIISERIYQALASQNLKGVMIKNTRDFDGYGI